MEVWRYTRTMNAGVTTTLLFAAVCMMCGCGGSDFVPGREPVFHTSGVVLFEGEPVEGASVVFRCRSVGRSATALTDSSGRFELTTFEDGDGAVEGEHVVHIRKVSVTTTPNPKGGVYPPIADETWHLPKHFADAKTSGLTAKVDPDGSNEFRFELKK